MGRWHLSNCSNPTIAIRSGKLHCLACHRSPPKDSSPSGEHTNTFLATPPDEPLGRLNLRWPSTVNYLNCAPATLRGTKPTGCNGPSTSNSAYSAVYHRRLRRNEIRLVHLSPSPLSRAPLHLNLATYLDDDYPDYEAVSYTWGGDTSDSTPRVPAYIGPFWDIILLTRNCAAMLFYARRPDTQRPLWVDAICINQIDIEEKSVQIPKMASVYKQCLRVLVYLGEQATVSPHRSGRRFPKRQPISNLANDRDTLVQMLQSRYFSRLWVIQELILARHVVFVYRGFEYHAEAASASRVPFQISSAPWLSRLGQQSILSNDGLMGAITLTGRAKCADIRDKVFGILGLVQGDNAHLLIPDYTLSALHVFVGLFSHCVVASGQVRRVLHNSIGIKGWGTQPSWVPEWDAEGITLTDFSDENYSRQLSSSISSRVAPFLSYSYSLYGNTGFNAQRIVWCNRSSDFDFKFDHRLLFPAPQRCSVEANTGALSLRLVHLYTLQRPLENSNMCFTTETQQQLHSFHVRSRGRRSQAMIILLALNSNLDQIADHETDHIFYAGSDVPLLMRKFNDGGDYKIVAPLHSVYVMAPGGWMYGETGLDISILLDFGAAASLKTSPPQFTAHRELSDPYLEKIDAIAKQRQETRIAKRVRKQLFPGATTAEAILPSLQGILDHQHNVQDINIITSQFHGFYTKFNEVNKSVLTSQSPTALYNNPPQFIEFAFSSAHFQYVMEHYCTPLFYATEDPDGSRRIQEEGLYNQNLLHWEWLRQGEWLGLQDADGPGQKSELIRHISALSIAGTKAAPVRLRTNASNAIHILMWYTWEMDVLKRLGCAQGRNELERLYELNGESSFLRRIKQKVKPVWPTRDVVPYNWSRSAIYEFGMDGVPEYVTIF